MKLGLRFSAVFCGLALIAACGGGDDSSGSGGSTSTGGSTAGGGTSAGGTGASSSGGNAGASGGGSGGTTSGGAGGAAGSASGGTSSGGAAGAGALAQCKAQAATNPDPACANCACDNCLNELAACEADPTCVALRDCAQQNNCCDDVCVLLHCSSELTKAGGISGEGTAKASAVKDCTVAHTCNCCK